MYTESQVASASTLVGHVMDLRTATKMSTSEGDWNMMLRLTAQTAGLIGIEAIQFGKAVREHIARRPR